MDGSATQIIFKSTVDFPNYMFRTMLWDQTVYHANTVNKANTGIC
jgi:hypothetical protein